MKTNCSFSSIMAAIRSSLGNVFHSGSFRRALGLLLVVANLASTTGMVVAKEISDETSADTAYVSGETVETGSDTSSEETTEAEPAEGTTSSAEETSSAVSDPSKDETTAEPEESSDSTSASSDTDATTSQNTEESTEAGTEATTDGTSATEEETTTSSETTSSSSETSSVSPDTSESSDTTVKTFKGNHFTVTVSYGPETNIPKEAILQVREITSESECDALYAQLDTVMDSSSISTARFFDISLVMNGFACEPSDGTRVSVKINLDEVYDEAVSVVHLPDYKTADVVENASTASDAGTEVTFEADGFSAYAIVTGPEDIPLDSGWRNIATVEELQNFVDENGNPKGVYIGLVASKGGYYFTDGLTEHIGGGSASRSGITKTFPSNNSTTPGADAVRYYFEFKPGTNNQVRAYCMDGSTKKYIVQNSKDNSLYFTTDPNPTTETDTANVWFTISLADTSGKKFYITGKGSQNWNMQNGETTASSTNKGYAFCVWKSDNDNNSKIVLVYDKPLVGDPYELDGKTYGLMDYDLGVIGKALMAEECSGHPDALEAKAMTVMAKKTDNDDKLFVPKDADITMWTFHWQENNKYYITTEVNGVTKYLNISSTGPSISDTAQLIMVQPGVGATKGQISLRSDDTAMVYSGALETGFTVGAKTSDNQWLNLVRLSELTKEYYMVYTAERVGISQKDTNGDFIVQNGTKVLIYTRVWNESKKNYEFFAVDHDGSLVPCYEDGDMIQWVGHGLNTMLWDFTEYYWEGTTDPNQYYELYNEYSEKYLAPQLKTGEDGSTVLWDNPVGINLPGRENGEYYTKIQAWDEINQDFARVSSLNGQVISYPIPIGQGSTDEKDDFYFAIVQDVFEEKETHYVPTIDNNEFGITMRMVNFNNTYTHDGKERTHEQTDFFVDDEYNDRTGTKGLLSTSLGDDGYPVSSANGRSLSELYSGPELRTVNHLFLESIYLSSGYFEFDSTENFATLNYDGSDTHTDFRVYQELATVDNSSKPSLKHGLFLPYDGLDAGDFAQVNPKNLYDAEQKLLPDDHPRKNEDLYLIRDPDYYFGMELETSFVQTPSGHDEWGHDIIYEFTGDDDFWLYVDGELLIDLGGIHRALKGTVNYSTGEVVVNGTKTTIRDVFRSNYEDPERGMSAAEVEAKLDEIFEAHTDASGKTYWTFKDYSAHTMKIFYMERGGGSSNLHMRFNQSSVKPGTVLLSKEISGADSMESTLAGFPYQIYYSNTEDGTYSLLSPDNDRNIYVHYKGTENPATYEEHATIEGLTYDSVFYLKPGQECEIKMPDDAMYYYVVECGVDPQIYNQVFVNGSEVTLDSGYVTERSNGYRDYSIPKQEVRGRTSVKYVNNVNPDALRTLTFKKWLFEEDGVTPVEDDAVTFNFRLYLDMELNRSALDEAAIKDHPANMYIYHVKDKNGVYCQWDVASQKYVPIASGKTDYDQLTDDEKRAVSCRTSIYGAITKVPAYYTVEVRQVFIGTQYLIEERENEIPDGYSLHGYVTDATGQEMDPTNYTPSMNKPMGVMVKNQDPHADIVNLKGFGFRMYKEWNDEAFMLERDAAYFAIYYTDPDTQQLTLVPDSVRCLKKGEETNYWYFERLAERTGIGDYMIREVSLTNPVVDAAGNVTFDGVPQVVNEGGKVIIYGKQIGTDTMAPGEYTVHYEDPEQTANVKVQRIENSRSGFDIFKVEWDSVTKVGGAEFKLEYKDGNTYKTIGTFTSSTDGFVTTTFLTDGIEYRLTETKTPQGFIGMEDPITFVKQADGIHYSGADAAYYFESAGDADHSPSLSIKNKPYELTVIKVDEFGNLLPGAKFALYKEKNVSGVVGMDPKPMPGYEELISGSDGVIPKLDRTLPAGTYEIRETSAPAGYQKMTYAVKFTVEPSGNIVLKGTYDSHVEWDVDTTTSVDDVFYTLTLTNRVEGTLTITKTVEGNQADPNQKFTFNVEFYDEFNDLMKNETIHLKYSNGTEKDVTLNTNGCATVQLKHGESVLITGLPKDGTYTVTETNASDYTVKCREGSASFETRTVISGTITSTTQVDYLNRKDAVMPTGLDFSFKAIVGAILILLVSGTAMILLNRRNDDEDEEDGESA